MVSSLKFVEEAFITQETPLKDIMGGFKEFFREFPGLLSSAFKQI